MRHGGPLHIVLGAAAMLTFGLRYLGARRTLTFFALATTLSLGMELLGTGTGWPFGAYSYTSGLGTKVLGRVPYTIPLSWFFVGMAAYLLASAIVARLGIRRSALGAVLLGVWFLTVWDLVLDPAMAHPALPTQFWVWHATGPYFGMPLQNFVGWSVTGFLFMGLSRLLWRRNAGPDEFPAWLPFGIYTANIVFALALSLSVGLWQPAIAAVFLGVLPATLALGRTTSPAATAMRLGSRAIAGRRLQLTVEGLEHVPTSGPALIAARHYHHLYDGCALIATLPRPVHILVALDWVDRPIVRRVMERGLRRGALADRAPWRRHVPPRRPHRLQSGRAPSLPAPRGDRDGRPAARGRGRGGLPRGLPQRRPDLHAQDGRRLPPLPPRLRRARGPGRAGRPPTGPDHPGGAGVPAR